MMAYQMQYNFQTVNIEKVTKAPRFKYILLTLVFVFCLIGVHFGGSVLEMLLLGEGKNVNTALTQMVDSLHDGEEVKDAVSVFCDNIIE